MSLIAFATSGAVRVLVQGQWGCQQVERNCLRICNYQNIVRNRGYQRVANVQMMTSEEQPEKDDYMERIRSITRVDELPSIAEQVAHLVPLATEDANQQVRYAAISRLSNLDASRLSEEDGKTVLQAARHALKEDKEPSCQAAAADLIAGLRLYDGFDDLVTTFNETSDWVLKFSIAAGVGEMHHPQSYEFLQGVLEHYSEDSNDALLIAAAIGALGDLGDERGVSVVEKYLDHPDSSIQDRARIAHDRLSSSSSS